MVLSTNLQKLRWDEEIPLQYGQCWESWLNDLPKFSLFTVYHCLRPPEFGQTTSSQLYHFSDASEAGYGCVSYLRSVNKEGKICYVFLFLQSHFAPLKTISIPRSELSAATLSVCHDKNAEKRVGHST